MPRKCINKFECTFNGQQVFTGDMDPSVSANPYLEFTAKVTEAGTFDFKWTDDDGTVYETSKDIAIK